MSEPKATPRAKRWTKSARSLAALTMMLSASACATATAPIPASSDNAFCARWPDAAHPPIAIYDGDGDVEANDKIDLLIVWEVMCGIAR